MLRSSRHPYQATTVPQPQLHGRNAWTDKPESSTNSSCASRGGRASLKNPGPPPAAEWLLPRNHQTMMSHHGLLLNQQVHPVVVPSRGPGSTAVSTVHGSSAAVSVAGGIDSCGGQCIACETFCYYCLQVFFIAGILTGISLTIAGSVLRGNHRGGDLMVLVYIGVLLSLVCTLLLSVHYCVRRNVKERKRALRLARIQGQRRMNPPTEFTSIPMQDFISEPTYRESCADTNLNEFDYVDNSRPHVNIITNPAYHSNPRPFNRSGSSSRSHDRRFHVNDFANRHVYDWERQSYQPVVHRPNR